MGEENLNQAAPQNEEVSATPSAENQEVQQEATPQAESAIAEAAKDAAIADKKDGDPSESAVASAVKQGEVNDGENTDATEEKADKDNTGIAPNTPENVDYAKELKVPDGIKLDEGEFGKACAIFKEMNLPKESAQKLLDFSLEMQKGQSVAAAQEKKRVLESCKNEIAKREHFNDEVPLVCSFVRDLQKNPDTVKIADFLTDGVFGNLPEVWELTVYCARQMATEGRLVAGGKGGDPKELPLPERMYPSMKTNGN